MSNVDNMRKLMETIDNAETQQVDEAGGIIDKMLAKLPGGERAETRVEMKKEIQHIKSGWKKYSTANKLKDDDAEGFKRFLAYWEFDGNEIDEIIGDGAFNIKDSFDRAAQTQWTAGKGPTGAERGGPFKKEAPKDDIESIMTLYQKTLGGNPALLQAELGAIKKPEQLGDDALAMLGYSFMKASGKGKK